MTAAQELLEEKARQVEQVLEVRVPRIVAKDYKDSFHCLSDEEFLERYRLPMDVVTDLIKKIKQRTHVDRTSVEVENIKNSIFCTIAMLCKI